MKKGLHVLQALPEEVASLYGSFPPELYSSLDGLVPESDLGKAKHRVPTEYSKLPEQAVAGASEAQFNRAFSVRSWATFLLTTDVIRISLQFLLLEFVRMSCNMVY